MVGRVEGGRSGGVWVDERESQWFVRGWQVVI